MTHIAAGNAAPNIQSLLAAHPQQLAGLDPNLVGQLLQVLQMRKQGTKPPGEQMRTLARLIGQLDPSVIKQLLGGAAGLPGAGATQLSNAGATQLSNAAANAPFAGANAPFGGVAPFAGANAPFGGMAPFGGVAPLGSAGINPWGTSQLGAPASCFPMTAPFATACGANWAACGSPFGQGLAGCFGASFGGCFGQGLQAPMMNAANSFCAPRAIAQPQIPFCPAPQFPAVTANQPFGLPTKGGLPNAPFAAPTKGATANTPFAAPTKGGLPNAPFGVPTKGGAPVAPGNKQMWDVFFDHGDAQKAKQLSPIVLDLNGNGRPDITGKNIKGDGKIDGKAIEFDLDPTKRSWSSKSVRRRPGKGAPAVAGAYAKIYDKDGKLTNEKATPAEAMKIKDGRAEIYDNANKLTGELKDGGGGKMMYHWGKLQEKEKTEWLTPGGGDGMLVWDVNGDGKIDSSKELFGNFDINGEKKFNNGYEKLSAYFDLNRDGRINGGELQRAQQMGVQVWADQNGDGNTDVGELQSLAQHQIWNLNTGFNEADMSSTYGAGYGY